MDFGTVQITIWMFLWKLICSSWFVSKCFCVGLNWSSQSQSKNDNLGKLCLSLVKLYFNSFPAGAYTSLILQDKLKNTRVGKQEGMVGAEIEAGLALPNDSVNILNSDSVSRNVHWESETHENSDSRTKHHQLKTSSRAAAAAAG